MQAEPGFGAGDDPDNDLDDDGITREALFTVVNKRSPYRYSPIMHFGRFAFWKTIQSTIEPVPPAQTFGQRTGLSAGDINLNHTTEQLSETVDVAQVNTTGGARSNRQPDRDRLPEQNVSYASREPNPTPCSTQQKYLKNARTRPRDMAFHCGGCTL